MDISSLGIGGVAVITVICFLVGQLVKATGLTTSIFPVIVGVAGGAGRAGHIRHAEFPATDYMTAVAVGIVSGLAATGINQVYKQLTREG